MIHQLRTSPLVASLNIGTSPLVSPHESTKIWSSSLISSRVHHHPLTYPLIAQHLLIQVLHHNIKTKLRKARCTIQGTYSSWSQGFQCFHEPVCSWSNSTNLLARSPTLQTSPSVVQHMWSTSYEPLRSQHLSSVSTKHTNLPARIPIREH